MNPVWREILLITLFNIAAICLAVGVLLSIAPQRFLAATARLNRWVSTDAAFESLDRSRPADRFFYRRHLWVGALLALGSLYILYTFWVWYDRAHVLPALPVIYNAAASGWVYDSLAILLRGIGVVGLLAGIVVALRPSLLKALEGIANRWIATERWTRSLDRQKDLPPEWFPGRPRLFGVGIVLGSGYMMWQCGRALWGGS
jgi:hypothetical protein